MTSNGQRNGKDRKPVLDTKNWYSLSLDTVRGWIIVFLLIGGGIVAVYGYGYLQSLSTERRAMMVIEEAALKLGRVQREATGGTGTMAYNEAWHGLQSARQELARGDYEAALVSARWSSNLFSSLLDDLRNKAPGGEAQFTGVQGGVEFRRGDGPWQLARSRIVLRSGDYVKTGDNGSAEVEFADGTSFNVRPNTVVLISRRGASGGESQETVTLEYGWIDLDTSEHGGRVRTPEAEATVGRSSRVELSYDRDRRAGRFTSHEGSMVVETRVGTIRRIGTRELVMMTTAGLSASMRLPASPEPMWPSPEAGLKLADEEVVVRWKRVEGAARYALQVSRDGFFIDNVIDVENRSGNSARVGLLGEGDFQWRVAAFNRQGFKGAWSEPRAFRVSTGAAGG